MTYEVGDCTNMRFPNDCFDAAIDKSTIDALLCGDHSYERVAIMMKEIQRVLKPGGIYFCITYGTPENRDPHFERAFLNWEIR